MRLQGAPHQPLLPKWLQALWRTMGSGPPAANPIPAKDLDMYPFPPCLFLSGSVPSFSLIVTPVHLLDPPTRFHRCSSPEEYSKKSIYLRTLKGFICLFISDENSPQTNPGESSMGWGFIASVTLKAKGSRQYQMWLDPGSQFCHQSTPSTATVCASVYVCVILSV